MIQAGRAGFEVTATGGGGRGRQEARARGLPELALWQKVRVAQRHTVGSRLYFSGGDELLQFGADRREALRPIGRALGGAPRHQVAQAAAARRLCTWDRD